jgi:hypothetical protein
VGSILKVKDLNGNIIDIPAIKGDKGDKGDPCELFKIELAIDSATLEPNTYYSFGEVATLTVNFAEGDSAKYEEYMFNFTSGETPTVLTLPSSVQWANELTIEANKRYEVSIVDNIGLWCAVDLAVTE